MKIYLDYIFLENLVVNTVIIIETIILTNFSVSKKKRIFIIFLDTFISTIMKIIPQLDNFLIHIILSSLSLFILFKFKNIFEFIKNLISYYLIYFIYIGIIISFSIIFNINLENILIKLALYIFSASILNILVKDLWKMWKSKIKISDLYYELKINDVKIKSFIDTGNTVKDPISLLNVIFLNKNLKNSLNLDVNKKIAFNVSTVSGNDIKEGYIVKNVKVIKDGREIAKIPKIILCFSLTSNTPEKYSAIIGYDTYLENISGGVSY